MNLSMKNGRIVVDGREFRGNNVTISDGKVVVDGVLQSGELTGDINIVVHGDIEKLQNTSGDVTAKNVGSIKTTSGDIKCEEVGGSISTVSGDVSCGDISGSVKTVSGDIERR